VHEGHPFVAGLPPRRRQRWGSVHSGDEGRWFRRAPVLTQVRPWAVDPFSTRSAGVSMDANKYTPAKECRPAEAIALPGGELPHQP